MQYDLIACVVTFNNPLPMLERCARSFLATSLRVKLVFVDNSANENIERLCASVGVEYIRSPGNVGFGSGHNVAIRRYAEHGRYFLVLNPDVFIPSGTCELLVSFMDQHPAVPLCAPRVLNPDGSLQRVHKRLPSFSGLFLRRFLPGLARRLDFHYEMQDYNFEQNMIVPSISGCFMFFRATSLRQIGGFDERFFMYMEDIDITRRASKLGPCVVVAAGAIEHEWARGSHKSRFLTWVNITSALKYFLKWGPSTRALSGPYDG